MRSTSRAALVARASVRCCSPRRRRPENRTRLIERLEGWPMGLITTKYLKDSTETPYQYNTDAGWSAVSRGLQLVVVGYFVMIAGSILGVLVIRLAVGDGFIIRNGDQSATTRDTLLLLGVVLLGLTALGSYGLVLTGQWHCLKYAPQHLNAKELMYICVNCVLLGSALNAAGAYLDG